jgi:hypothetical protein
MKIKKHHQGTIGQWLSPFVIINLNDSVVDEDLHDIVQIFQNNYNNTPEYWLFVGRYSIICKIIDHIMGLYNVDYIGDNYCIASRKSSYDNYIPKAKIEKSSNIFMLEIRGVNILCVPELFTLNSLAGNPILDEINITINFKPVCNVDCSDPDIMPKVQNISGASIQAIYLPYYQLEHLHRCLAASVA